MATTFGKYIVIRPLGKGGMGDVYLARDPMLERDVAIKVILPQLTRQPGFYERFHREARLVASLRHPHIVQVYDFAIERGDPTTDSDDQPFMVMEYLDGGSLKEQLAKLRDKGETMPLSEIAHIAGAIASALDYAHAHGAVHRDVKPANILFTSQGEPVLTDFGVAKIVSETAQAGHISLSSGVIGSPAYMSPEQASGQPVDARSDVYSLGIVLYEMVSGRTPFQGDSPTAVLQQQVNKPPPPPTQINLHVPEAVQTVILKALAKQPNERFASAGELARALNDAMAASPTSAVSLDAPTIIESPQTQSPPVNQSTLQPNNPQGWLASLGELANAVSPLVGQGAAKTEKLPQGRLRQVVAIVSFVAIILAAIDFVFRTIDRATQQFARLTGLLPYLIVPLFAGAFALAVFGAIKARSRANRRLALGVAAALGLLGVAWGAWTIYDQARPPAGPIVLVADFERKCQDCPDVNYGDRIREILVTQIRRFKLSNIEIRRAFQSFPDEAAARAQGAANKAAVAIWGWYDAKGIQPRIELLRTPQNLTNRLILPEELPFNDFAEADSDKEGAHLVLTAMGLARLAEADYPAALTFFNAALQAIDNAPDSPLPNSGIAHLFQSLTQSLMGEPASTAIEGLEQSVAFKPGWPDAHYLLSLAYLNGCTPNGARALDLSLQQSDEALKRKEDANMYWVRGAAQAGLRQWPDAARSYEQSLKLQDDPQTRSNLIEAYRMLGRNADAERVLRERSISPPDVGDDEVAGLRYEADSLFNEGKLADAVMKYQAAISRAVELKRNDDELSGLHLNLSFAYQALGQLDAALIELEQAEKLSNRGRFNYTLLAQTYRNLGRADDAIRTYQTALEVRPCDYEARLGLANQYAQQGQHDLALAEYERARIADPTNGVTFAQMANVYTQQGSADAATKALEEAARLFEEQIKLEPGNPKPASDLGKVYFLLGDFAKSAGAFEALVRLTPDDPQAHYLLGLAHAQNGDTDAAKAAFEWVVSDANASESLKREAEKALEGLK
jgi:serine/threonine protein kinase/tetratricopeptide (TPR) repeat protein